MDTEESASQEILKGATNEKTREHIANVTRFIHIIVVELLKRAEKHDASKLLSPEVETFVECTPKLRNLEYGSDEYKRTLEEMAPALEHHYAKNRHHPEHFPDGMSGMNLIDLVELFCDWKAASARHSTGNLKKSVEINADRFKMSPQLKSIFENTIDLLET